MLRSSFAVLLCLLLAPALPTLAVDLSTLSDGIVQVAAGDYTAAIQTLVPLSESSPDNTIVQYWLGRAYYGQRVYKLAAKYLGQAAANDSNNQDVCLWHARALRAARHYREAAEAYGSYTQHFADDSVLAEYAMTRALAGDYPGARETFARLTARDSSAQTQRLVAEWERTLEGLSSRSKLEPPGRYRAARFELRYDPEDPAAQLIREEIERARVEIGKAMGIDIAGFRILAFPTWDAYTRYARLFLPETQGVHSAAFTMPGTLVLWSPGNWPRRKDTTEEFVAILRHEMVHLAIAIRTGNEGVPHWLNEGIACHFGGWGGMQAGQLPAPPLSLPALNRAFLSGEMSTQEQGYAQAHAMATVLAATLGTTNLMRLLDQLAAGVPLPQAYEPLAQEPLTTFLTQWPERFRALTK